MKDIEFLPEHHIRARLNQRLRFIRLWLLIVMALSMVCWTLYSEGRDATVSAQMGGVEGTLAVVDADLERMARLVTEERDYAAHKKLVRELEGGGPRTRLVRELVSRLPEEVFLTRLEVEVQAREVQAAAETGGRERRGARAESKRETVDRIRVEGLAADDLSLARFLQGLADSKVFERGDLAFSKDAEFRGRSVRVFAATFYVLPEDRSAADGWGDQRL